MPTNRGKRFTTKEALERINQKCLEKNVLFIRFNNQENVYENDRTQLVLKCNRCENTWDTTTFGKFTRASHSCPNCSPTKKLTNEKLIKRIKNACQEKDLTFIDFYGEKHGVYTKLILKCNKCGYVWNTTTINNLCKKDRKSHTCGRKPPLIPQNETRAIKTIKKHLENTSLEFVSFDENGYKNVKRPKILLKCKKCGKIMCYSYHYVTRNIIKCKNCEQGGKFSNEHAVNLITNQCEKLNYTFIGFDNNENKYNGKKTYLILKCNKCGNIWNSTNFSNFLNSTIKCPKCLNSWKMEKEVESLLRKNKIDFIPQCRNRILPWLKNKISLTLDFYLPQYKIGIECQGRQHFEPVLNFGGEKTFQETLKRDEIKLKLCKEHNIKMLYYDSEHNHTEFLGEKVYNNENNLINEILKYEKN